MDKSIKIFGREPAVWVGVIEALLAVLLAFGIGLSETTYGPIMAVIVALGGFITALGTKDTLLGALIGVIKAGIVLFATYGITISEQQTGSLIAAVSVVFALYQRTQTSPISDPVDPSPAQVVPVPAPVEVKDAVEDAAAAGDVAPIDSPPAPGAPAGDVVGAPQEADADTVVVDEAADAEPVEVQGEEFDNESDVLDEPGADPDSVEEVDDRQETEGK